MKAVVSIVLSTLILSSAGLNAVAFLPDDAAAQEVTSQITSAGAIVIDFDTGDELYAHNADVLRDPASMTKMMTVYFIYQALEDGQIQLDTIVPISEYAYERSRIPNETNVYLSTSGVYTVDELLNAVIVVSAGGATVALAELISGTTREFTKLMNAKAEEWGIDAQFQGVSGGGEGTDVTPRAMAVITRNTIMQFPQVLERTSLRSIVFGQWTHPSSNTLLDVYEGIDGYKTGTNSYAKENFAATAKRGDVRLISVTMGSNYGKRFNDTTILLDYGFSVMEERLEAARLEEEARIEAERLEAERLEQERLAEEARLEALRLEEEARIEAERLETARMERAARTAESARVAEIARIEERIRNENLRRDFHITITAVIILTCLIAGTVAAMYVTYQKNPKRPQKHISLRLFGNRHHK